MIINFKIFEAKRGRPKTLWVKCIKDYDYILNDEHLKANPGIKPRTVINDKYYYYPYFNKGEKYKMTGPYETYSGRYIVYIDTKLKNAYARESGNYPKFLYEQFIFYIPDNKPNFDRNFEDYFELPEETKEQLQWWYEYIKLLKTADKYNL